MTLKTFVCTVLFAAVSAQGEQLILSGYEISFSDGCSIVLSLNGTIREVILPAGDIKRSSSNQIKNVGSAEIKPDSNGNIKRVGIADVKRDPDGNIKSVGGVEIKRGPDGAITRIGGAEIKLDSSGKIKSVNDNGESVKPVFAVTENN